MEGGWIKLHRKIRNHWIFDNPEYLKAWLIILLEVNHKDGKALVGGKLLKCKRGQSLNSLSTWAKLFGRNWTIQKVRTFFKLLKDDSMINIEGLKNTTRLTVINYEAYQSEITSSQHVDNTQITYKQHTDNTQLTRTQHTANTQITTNKNVKNEKNEKNNNILSKKSDDFSARMQQIFNKWNEFANRMNLAKIQILTGKRKQKLKARLREKEFDFELILQKIEESDFLLGLKSDWKVSFDFVINSKDNYVKILEGRYSNNLAAGKTDEEIKAEQKKKEVFEMWGIKA